MQGLTLTLIAKVLKQYFVRSIFPWTILGDLVNSRSSQSGGFMPARACKHRIVCKIRIPGSPKIGSTMLVTKISGQAYKGSTIVNYDSRVVPDLKIPHITTLGS